MDRAELLERIAKLERLAADPAAFPAESELAQRKADELRAKLPTATQAELDRDYLDELLGEPWAVNVEDAGGGRFVVHVYVPYRPADPPPSPRRARRRSASQGSRSSFSWRYTSQGPRSGRP